MPLVEPVGIAIALPLEFNDGKEYEPLELVQHGNAV